jgi:hypothetical protein
VLKEGREMTKPKTTLWYPLLACGVTKHEDHILVETVSGYDAAVSGPHLVEGDDDGVSACVTLTHDQAVNLLLALGAALGIEDAKAMAAPMAESPAA